MNKRVLISIGIVICMLFTVVMPLRVNAEDSVEGNENAIIENVPTNDETEKEDTDLVAENKNNSEEVQEVNLAEGETNLNDTKSDVEEGNADIESGEIYDIQKVKVITTKVDEEGNLLAGAKLQIKDQNGNILDEWVSTTESHQTLLPDGTYILHEEEAPEGYDLAEDQTFTVKVEIVELDAGSDASATPCPHYTGTQMYYVQIKGEKHEVYCINQNWDTPDDDSKYDGEILNADSIRDFTKQTVPIGLDEENPINIIMPDDPIDISEQSLTDQELYDKILDIIYHRHIAAEELGKQGFAYTTEEIRFITEVALKNYTNAGLTERQYNVKATEALLSAFDAAGVVYKTYVKNGVTYVSYLKHNYRDYVYVPDADLGKDIVKTDYGNGNSFGQMVAGHWNSYSNTNYLHPDADPSTQAHNAKNNQADRDTVARYYALFEFLISNSNPHPKEMHLYIYSSSTTPLDPAGNNNDSKYQNLLGVTGYYEEVPQQKQELTMVNKYSTETTELTVTKVWADDENETGKRPENVTIILLANNSEYDKVVLSEENNWQYVFADLPVYDKGKKIEWYVREDNIPEGYVSSIELDGTTGFIIHNVLGQGDHEPPKENPQTGDNIILYILTLLVSTIGLVSGKHYLKENN